MTEERIRGRYAPSPTGDLHLGNLRTALLTWLFARMVNGQVILRIEDLDRPRTRVGATQRIINDLRWLGLNWDEGPDIAGPFAPYTQSERLSIYQNYLQRLHTNGLLYPCYCTRAEIAYAASAPQQGSGDGPRYPGTCRHLTRQQRLLHEISGRQPSLRIRIDTTHITSFTDLLAGPQQQCVQHEVGDFIIQRADGIFAYQFAVVVDDGLMQINQVVRGADLLSSTARQILLFEALGFAPPTFAHVPLLLDSDGKRLSKRTQSAGLDPLRATGLTSADIIGQLAASCNLIAPATPIDFPGLVARYQDQPYDIIRSKLYAL